MAASMGPGGPMDRQGVVTLTDGGHRYRPGNAYHHLCLNGCGAMVTETPDGDAYADPSGPCPKRRGN